MFADVPAFVRGLSFEHLPDAAVASARRCLLDLIGVAAAASATPAAGDRQRVRGDAALRQRPQRAHPARRPARRSCRCRLRRRDDDRLARRARRPCADQRSRGRRGAAGAAVVHRRCAAGRSGGRHRRTRVPHLPGAGLRNRHARRHRAARDRARLSLLGRVECAGLRGDRGAASRIRSRTHPPCARRGRVLRPARADPARLRLPVDGQGRLRAGARTSASPRRCSRATDSPARRR